LRCLQSRTIVYWRRPDVNDIIFMTKVSSVRVLFSYFGAVLWLITHAGIASGVGMAFSLVCLFVCLSVCPRSNRKTAWAINTKLGTHILYSSRSACVDPEVKRSKVKVTRLQKPSGRTIARDACCYGRCRRGSACRYDCLCFPVVTLFSVLRLGHPTLSAKALCFQTFLPLHSSVGRDRSWTACAVLIIFIGDIH